MTNSKLTNSKLTKRHPMTGRKIELKTVSKKRECGGCTACCEAVGVQELKKPYYAKCEHQRDGVGCGIYADRPDSCRAYKCLWLADAMHIEHRPDKFGAVFEINVDTSDDPKTGRPSTDLWLDVHILKSCKNRLAVMQMANQMLVVLRSHVRGVRFTKYDLVYNVKYEVDESKYPGSGAGHGGSTWATRDGVHYFLEAPKRPSCSVPLAPSCDAPLAPGVQPTESECPIL